MSDALEPAGAGAEIDYADYGAALGDAVSVVRNNATAAGLHAAVPTCPGWTVRDLVVHLGLVHRWGTGVIAGTAPEQARRQAEGAAQAIEGDVLDWLDDGLVDLLNALAGAPQDLAVFFFLKNTPSARWGWARRQCHETTIHAVDAMAARLGEPPAADQTWIRSALAADGIDELLRGFLPRRSSRLRSADPLTVAVTAQDTGDVWTLQVSQDPPTVQRASGRPGPADVVVTGAAVPLYLALWNRGNTRANPLDVAGPEDWPARWQEMTRVAFG